VGHPDLDGHIPAEPIIVGAMDLAHAAYAEAGHNRTRTERATVFQRHTDGARIISDPTEGRRDPRRRRHAMDGGPDKSALGVWLLVSILGILLALFAWYRFLV